MLCGRALKLSQWFSGCDKQYEAAIRFGIETDTLDPTGTVIAEAPVPERATVEKMLKQFTGQIMQAPPAYSAIHINGKRASDLARKGQAPEMVKRPVTIYEIELESWQPPVAYVKVHCSSGTYIRSLARDIALAAGSRAHLASLVRTRVAGFGLEETEERRVRGCVPAVRRGLTRNLNRASLRAKVPLLIGTEEGIAGNPQSPVPRTFGSTPFLHPIDKAVVSTLGLPWFEVSEEDAVTIIHGKPLSVILGNKTPVYPENHLYTENYQQEEKFNKEIHAAVFCKEELIAVVEKKEGKWKYGCVY